MLEPKRVCVQVEPGSSAELPLWLCKVLSSKDLVQVKRPTFLGERCARHTCTVEAVIEFTCTHHHG